MTRFARLFPLFALTLVSSILPNLCAAEPIDAIIIEKAAHRMTLLSKGAVVASYEVALGRGGLGRKSKEGDNLTPEGKYVITGRNKNSAYHLSLRISYPSQDDIAKAKARGVAPGGDIMIHGIWNGLGWMGALHRKMDWTAGCIAVTNDEIEEIWKQVPDGTPVEIKP